MQNCPEFIVFFVVVVFIVVVDVFIVIVFVIVLLVFVVFVVVVFWWHSRKINVCKGNQVEEVGEGSNEDNDQTVCNKEDSVLPHSLVLGKDG